ncbi:hypothetical protein [Microbacterium binotii]|uniref:hypothetical protein n=1 Tax=Microbacterium binotii TaxID=462710 RepID=UPI001F1DE6C1|nr:hypothetical protein [Microbacterium binotii]UIN30926.1 hypothetical protein LXM64_01585 [Microbacterium binotii]
MAMAVRIENQRVRITELLEPDGFSLAGMVATNVTFVGPAVLALVGDISFLGATRLNGSVEELLWDIPDHRISAIGSIDISGAVFTDCTFSMIGFAGRHYMLQQFIRSATIAPKV